MSNIVEVHKVIDGDRNLVLHIHLDGDGSGEEVYTNILDASVGDFPFTELKLMEVQSNLVGFTVELVFEGTALASGTTTATTANKLVDSGADFVTAGVAVGDFVFNSTDSTEAVVTAIDSATQLSISSDIFVSGEGYEIDSKDHAWVCPDYEQTKDFTKIGGLSNTLKLGNPNGDMSILTRGLGANDTGHLVLCLKKQNQV